MKENPYFGIFKGQEVKVSDIVAEDTGLEKTVDILIEVSDNRFVGQYLLNGDQVIFERGRNQNGS